MSLASYRAAPPRDPCTLIIAKKYDCAQVSLFHALLHDPLDPRTPLPSAALGAEKLARVVPLPMGMLLLHDPRSGHWADLFR